MLARNHWPTICRVGAACFLLLLAGCPRGQKPPVEPVTPVVEQPSAPKTYQLDKLKVGLASYLPPLDESRIEIAPPENWKEGSQQVGFLAWFHRFDDAKRLPQIRITAEPTPVESLADVTTENVAEFSEWLSGHVKQNLKRPDELIEPVRPLILGDNAFGRYVRKGRYEGSDAEQHILVTSRGGRLYTLRQLVPKGDLVKPEVRDAAYALGAGLKFQATGEPPDGGTPPATDPPAEPPPTP